MLFIFETLATLLWYVLVVWFVLLLVGCCLSDDYWKNRNRKQ